MKMAPTFQYLNKLSNRSNQDHHRYCRVKVGYDAKQEKTDAAVKLDDDDDDHVIGLKLDKWPDLVQQQFTLKWKQG